MEHQSFYKSFLQELNQVLKKNLIKYSRKIYSCFHRGKEKMKPLRNIYYSLLNKACTQEKLVKQTLTSWVGSEPYWAGKKEMPKSSHSISAKRKTEKHYEVHVQRLTKD